MTDERFDRDLRQVLAGIAEREAPASLRDRIAQIIDEAPVSSRLWFASPLRLSLAAVTAVALVALAIFFSTSRLVGPSPSASPTPGAPSVSPTESATPTATPEPTPTAAPSPTLQPTPDWSGLDWSSGPGINNDNGYAVVNDVLRWGDGYVGVGEFRGTDRTVASAFLSSPDGTHWTLNQLGPPIQPDNATSGDPQGAARLLHVLAAGQGLLAAGLTPEGANVAPTLWRSDDGHSWARIQSATWQEAWDARIHGVGFLVAMASGPGGLVALGDAQANCCANPPGPPIIITSSDGQTWHRLTLSSAYAHAHVLALTAYADGFVMVGYTGDYHFESDMHDLVGVSRPAAWTSADGLAWTQASVEGDAAAGVQLSDVVAGADGLFAVGRRAGAPAATLVGDGVNATSGWTSVDGRTWRLVGDLGKELPDIVRMSGDGTRMVIFGRPSCKATDIAGWVSTDGATWSRLPFSGSPPSQAIPGPICQDDGTEGWNDGGSYIALVWVVPDGVLVTTSGPAPPREFWFAAAITR